jgi:hypothetical protein
MAKIKFTSKRGEKPSKLQRAGGAQRSSMIFYKGESIMSVTGNSSLCLYCTPKNICLRLKNCVDHRAAVNWVKEHAQWIWDNYNLRIKSQLKEKES